MTANRKALIRTAKLTKDQKLEISKLVRECQSCDNNALSFPFEDSDLYYLHYTDDGILACVAALTFFCNTPNSEDGEGQNGYAECSAFTLPSLRRLGYFSSLFGLLSRDIEDTDLYFITVPSNKGAIRTLNSLEAVHEKDEYRMEIVPGTEQKGNFLPHKSRLSLIRKTNTEDGSVVLEFYLKNSSEHTRLPADTACLSSNLPAGSCRLFFSKDSACFYGFEIRKDLRGLGLGQEALLLTLSLLSDSLSGLFCSRMYLHVSGFNHPAVSLYRKTGFRVCETLSYYLY